MTTTAATMVQQPHKLADNWTLWAHLPQDPDWTLESYKKVATIKTLENAVSLMEHMPLNMVDNCMLFVMREGIKPLWEDPQNRNGGYFSYKISNKTVHRIWKRLFYTLIGGTIGTRAEFVNGVTGITISPKKNFCVVKIWTRGLEFQDPFIVNPECELPTEGCLFNKQKPEY